MPNVGSNNLPGHVLREYAVMAVDDGHIKQDNHQNYLVNGTVWWLVDINCPKQSSEVFWNNLNLA